jgi:hypothetical protein
MMDGICAVVYICDFDRFDPLVLALFEDVVIFAGCPEQLMMQCPKILACDVDFKNVGVR